VDDYPCIILLGDPGAGKTMALNFLAYEFACEASENKPGRSRLLPLYLRLSQFEPDQNLTTFIKQGWVDGSGDEEDQGASELANNLDRYLEAGSLFILFDALNEMPREGYRRRVKRLRHFIDKWREKGNRFIVSCRALDYGEELQGLQRIEIRPLIEAQIEEFLQKELPESWKGLWQLLIEEQAETRRLVEMARNPFFLGMIIEVFKYEGKLGRNRAELLNNFFEALLDWTLDDDDPKFPREEWPEARPELVQKSLAIAAFEMQKLGKFGADVAPHDFKKLIPAQVQLDPDFPPDPTPADQVVKLAAAAQLVTITPEKKSLRFYHQLLQEYFAACEMVQRDPASLEKYWTWPWLESEMRRWDRPEGNYDPLPPPPPTGWEETTILAAGLTPENDDQLLLALTGVNPVLAGRCLHEGQAKVDPAVRQQVIERLLETISRPEVALRVRIAAGEVLGYLGDPRLGRMVTIPAGAFTMGGKGKYDGKPKHQLFLPAYEIGQYPLSNIEYSHFIEAEGYGQKRWWTEAGWQRKEKAKWTEPGYWDDSGFNKPNQPVVGLSWYEAVAYCGWLRAETGRVYRLPTEAEWEKAARGPKGLTYPWGDKFDANRLNGGIGAQIVWGTTPVGMYPTGTSPYDLYDCAGNVWEWCATKYEKSYPYDVKENEWADGYLEGEADRVLRGGSWSNSHVVNFRCACRNRNWGYVRYDSECG
jgi:formylglycine-generating enzyme required for sulfatase activity